MENKSIELLHFIRGVQSTFEMGDVLDSEKHLEWFITEHDAFCMVKANWIIEIKKAPKIDNPIYQLDDTILYESYLFKIFHTDSDRKKCKEILEAIDIVNTNDLIIS